MPEPSQLSQVDSGQSAVCAGLRARSARRPIAFRFVALTMGLLVGLVGLEFSIRVWLTLRYDESIDDLTSEVPSDPMARVRLGEIIRAVDEPGVIYGLKPGARGTFVGSPLEINSRGWNDEELRDASGDRTVRVLGLGDSMMFGWGVDRTQTYMALLEREIRERTGDEWSVEFINTAVPGYAATQEVATYESLVDEIDPDVVLIHYVWNDLWLAGFIFRPGFLLTPYVFTLHPVALARGTFFNSDVFFHSDLQPLIPEEFRPFYGWEPLVDAYKRLAAECERRGIPLIALISSAELFTDRPDLQHDPKFEGFAQMSKELGIDRVDTFAAVRRHASEHGLTEAEYSIDYPRDTHPSPLRHALIAEALNSKVTAALARKHPALSEALAQIEPGAFLRTLEPGEEGLFAATDWNGEPVRWTRRRFRAELPDCDGELIVRYWIGHRDVTAEAPLTVLFEVEGMEPVEREHTSSGYFEAAVSPAPDPEGGTMVSVTVSRSFLEAPGGRRLGLAWYPPECR